MAIAWHGLRHGGGRRRPSVISEVAERPEMELENSMERHGTHHGAIDGGRRESSSAQGFAAVSRFAECGGDDVWRPVSRPMAGTARPWPPSARNHAGQGLPWPKTNPARVEKRAMAELWRRPGNDPWRTPRHGRERRSAMPPDPGFGSAVRRPWGDERRRIGRVGGRIPQWGLCGVTLTRCTTRFPLCAGGHEGFWAPVQRVIGTRQRNRDGWQRRHWTPPDIIPTSQRPSPTSQRRGPASQRRGGPSQRTPMGRHDSPPHHGDLTGRCKRGTVGSQ